MSEARRTERACRSSALLDAGALGGGLFALDFAWPGPAPRGGQFFMIKPDRCSVFLGRPFSAAWWDPARRALRFLAARRGRGTEELLDMRRGEKAELTGPLGNGWDDFLPEGGTGAVALVGGGAGVAPLLAFVPLLDGSFPFDFYGGFRFAVPDLPLFFPAALSRAREAVFAVEEGGGGRKGRIPDFLDPARYRAVYACGPEAMLKAVATLCREAGVPCFAGMERRMACGVGACLGCTVRTVQGNRRCCADGPVFPADEVFPDG
jgi:NAD(P)H-flavin reductase